jgi:AcrR family transcriptional regulator
MAKRDTKAGIVDAALTILSRDGPDKFSASALARETGVSKATIFHHFGSIDDIPLAAFERLVGATLCARPGADDSLPHLLSRIGGENLAFMRTRSDFLRAYKVFVARAMFDPRLATELRRSIGELLGRMRASMRPFLRDDADAAAMARLTGAIFDGLALHMLSTGDDAEIDAALALFVRLVAGQQKADQSENREGDR